MERLFDDEGHYLGVREGCKHEYVDSGPEENAIGFDNAAAAVNRDESALEICKRIKKELAKAWVAALDNAAEQSVIAAASGTWTRAERYIAAIEGNL